MNPSSALLSEVSKDSILQLIPGLHAIALEQGAIRAFQAGQELAKKGEPSTHLIIPLSAGLTLTDGDEKVGFLERRRALALREMIEGRPYPYSAVADQSTTALFLQSTTVLDLLYKNQEILHYLRLITRSAGLRSFRTFLLERAVEQKDVFRLFAQIPLKPLELNRGESPPKGALYFVRGGQLTIKRKDVAQPIRIGEGAFFGGQALIPPRTLDYSIEATEPTQLHGAPLAAVAPLLKDLLDALYEEPWLSPVAEGGARKGILTALPGEPIALDGLDPSKLILIQRDSDSVAASLCNLASVMGLKVNPARVEAGIALRDKLTLLTLAEEVEAFGMALTGARTAVLGPEDGPALLWLGPRLMVLVRAGDDGVQLIDPARGGIRVSHHALQGLWDGTLLRAQRTVARAPQNEEAVPSPTRNGRALVSELLGQHKVLLANMGALTLLGFALKMLGPLFTLYIFDDVLLLGRVDLVTGLAIGLVLSTVLGSLTTLAQHYLFNQFSVRFDADLTTQFYRQALSLPMSFYQKRRVGDVITRLQEISRIRDFFSGQTVVTAVNVVSILVNAAVLFAFSVPIALVALGMVALLIVVQLVSRPTVKRLHRRVFDANRRSTSLIAEMFAAVTTVKAANAEPILRGRWEQTFLDSVRSGRQLELRINTTQALINVVSSIGSTGVLWYACVAALAGDLSVGAILAVTMYLNNMVRPTLTLSSLLSFYEETRVAFDKLEEVFDAEPEESPATALVTHSARIRGKVRLERVSFRYSSDDPLVLKDVSLTIYPGQTVAIVGRSGSGKTTLANVIAGYTKPSTGRVFLDHYDASMLSQSCLRRQIGYVQQNYSLFGGTIGSNVAYADDAPDPVEIQRAGKDAHCQEFVQKFPLKYEYKLAPRGVGLSGGQRQRLAIARVLYKNPNILVMDEALSALDADSENAINENMRRITEGRTTIIIAHRVSTVRQADRIIVVNNGEVVEDGDHRTLLGKGGFYAELFEGQFEGEEERASA